MDAAIAPERMELAEAVRDYLAGTHGPEVLRRLDAGPNRSPQIWQGLVDMGLLGLLVPEEFGGLGMQLLDGVLIARECGRFAVAEPLVDTAFVAVPWLIQRGDRESLADDLVENLGETLPEMLAEIAKGARHYPLAHDINGWVADAAPEDAGAPLNSIDPLRNLSALPDDGRIAEGRSDDTLLNLGALMAAAQLVGLAEAMNDQAVEYAKIREQFGQPIGGFQAIKHSLANVAVALEFARPVLWRAAQAMDDGLESGPLHISHAKIAAGDAAMLAAETAIQVHGAMGYTYEVDLHFWMKRCWALNGAWGNKAYHLGRVDAAVIGAEQPIGPRHTFA